MIDFDKVIAAGFDAVKRYTDAGFTTLDDSLVKLCNHVTALECRIKDLEARPTISYQGTFNEGQSYRAGDAVTHRGGLWVARADTSIKPGDPGSKFTLAVKRPRNEMQGSPYA